MHSAGRYLAALALLASTPTLADVPSAPAPAATPLPNPLIDYAGFGRLVSELAPVREAHRLPWREFERRARRGDALLLDARSADAFARGHLAGAVNLPFTDFTDEALRKVIGDDPARPIYIYCNNNFSDNRDPVVTKRVSLALNIPTFINLHGYGYRNVWELGEVISTRDPAVPWQADAPAS